MTAPRWCWRAFSKQFLDVCSDLKTVVSWSFQNFSKLLFVPLQNRSCSNFLVRVWNLRYMERSQIPVIDWRLLNCVYQNSSSNDLGNYYGVSSFFYWLITPWMSHYRSVWIFWEGSGCSHLGILCARFGVHKENVKRFVRKRISIFSKPSQLIQFLTPRRFRNSFFMIASEFFENQNFV